MCRGTAHGLTRNEGRACEVTGGKSLAFNQRPKRLVDVAQRLDTRCVPIADILDVQRYDANKVILDLGATQRICLQPNTRATLTRADLHADIGDQDRHIAVPGRNVPMRVGGQRAVHLNHRRAIVAVDVRIAERTDLTLCIVRISENQHWRLWSVPVRRKGCSDICTAGCSPAQIMKRVRKVGLINCYCEGAVQAIPDGEPIILG